MNLFVFHGLGKYFIKIKIMKKIISGKTILLNTFSNCTWIATDLDEEVQTGNRENDNGIEWTGELTIGATEKEYRYIAEELWQLLDDIDTASDIFKPSENNGIESYKNFYKYVMEKHAERFKMLINDKNKLTIHPTYPRYKKKS